MATTAKDAKNTHHVMRKNIKNFVLILKGDLSWKKQ
nr:MAG TPA: hypothetical protein [Caudoviricetes sp.]